MGVCLGVCYYPFTDDNINDDSDDDYDEDDDEIVKYMIWLRLLW